jgi:hypothetical protein
MYLNVNCKAETSTLVTVCYCNIYLMITKRPSCDVDDKWMHSFLRGVFVLQVNTYIDWHHHCNITRGKIVLSCLTKPIFFCKRFSKKPHFVTSIVSTSVPIPTLPQYYTNATQIKRLPQFYSIWRINIELVEVAVVWCCLYRPYCN